MILPFLLELLLVIGCFYFVLLNLMMLLLMLYQGGLD